MLEVKRSGSILKISFKYNPEYITLIKTIAGRRWNPGEKCWEIPITMSKELERIFPRSLKWITPREEAIEEKAIQLWSEDDIDMDVLDHIKLKPYTYQMVAGSAFLPNIKTGLLADEVGLGKTLSAIIAFQQLYNQGKVRKAIVFCKKSLVFQWLSELRKFTYLDGIIITGTPEERKALYEEARKPEYHFVFLNYELLISDFEEKVPPGKKRKVPVYDPIRDLISSSVDVIILDEAQRIKNHKPKTTKRMRSLKNLVEYKWLLSGTPLENSPEDIFNLFFFMNSSILGTNPIPFRDRYLVLGRFGQPLGTKNLNELHQRIAPYMLRRTQDQVDHEFPELRIEEVLLDMSSTQERLHNRIKENIYNEIKGLPDDLSLDDEDDENNSVIGKFALLMQVANSPSLLEKSESPFAKKILKELQPSKTEMAYSPKYDWIQSYLGERRAVNPKGKTIIFSKYERVVQEIREILESDGFKVEIHTGKMNQAEREAAKENFWGESEIFISTDSGAEGLNLQCADLLINIDLPWNPSKFIQRWGRIKRAGSEHKKVKVVNLLCARSIDERVKQIFYSKSSMFEQVVEGTKEEREQIKKITKNVLFKLVAKRLRMPKES
jgi:SNF2 family DNA or RNA helicase